MKRDIDQLKTVVLRALSLMAQANAWVLRGERDLGLSPDECERLIVEQRFENGSHKNIGTVERRVLNVLVKHGLVTRGAGGFQISGAGRGFIRRSEDEFDPFQYQHQDREFVNIQSNGRTRTVVANKSESPLAWLLKRRGKGGKSLINDEQFNAGERLREDFCFAQMSPRVTASWSGASGGKSKRGGPASGSDMTDNVMAAKERVSTALDAVGPELAGALIDVCCHMTGLEALEKSNGWPQRSGKIVLVLALSALARHYGMARDGSLLRGKFETWNAPTGRANLDGWS